MDTKRFLVAAAVGMGMVLLWGYFFGPKEEGPPLRKRRVVRRSRKESGGRKGPRPVERRARKGQKADRLAPERKVVVDGGRYRAVFTNYGASLRSLVLKKRQYRERFGGALRQVDLVRTERPENLPLKLTVRSKEAPLVDPQVWDLVEGPVKEGGVQKIVFRIRRGTAEYWKEFRLWPDERYFFEMVVRVRNLGRERFKGRLTVSMPSRDFGEKGRSFFRPVSLKREAACRVNGAVKVRSLDYILGKGGSGCGGGGCGGCSCQRTPAKANSFAGRISWVGIDEKYFLLAAAPLKFEKPAQCRFGARRFGRGGLLWTDLNLPEEEVAPGKELVRRFLVFGGPKAVGELEGADAVAGPVHLVDSVDFGILGFLGKPMVWLMRIFYRGVGNWGLAIIIVTILIKLLTLPWTTKSMRSMKQMQRLKPEMDALKEKYGEDKVRYQQEVAALMKRHQVSPLSGCLPMLLQMPVYIAWYQALMASVELYRAPLFGWIDDLTAPDRYYVLPLLMGVAMFLQQRMTPQAADNPQAKMMAYMMPIMFTFFMLFLPAGLTLYILVNVLLSMAHQWYLNHAEEGA